MKVISRALRGVREHARTQLVSVATVALAHTPMTQVTPLFLAGLLVVAAGAATVLAFGPRGHAPAAPAAGKPAVA